METRTMHTHFYQKIEIDSSASEITEVSPHQELTRLALAAAGGNLQAYQALVNHQSFLTSLTKATRWMCRHSAIESDELLSEFFLRLPSKIRKYSGRHGASVVSWAGGVLRHLHIDMLRRQWRDTDRVEYMDLVAIEQERSVDSADSKVALQQAYSRLSEREKSLLELRRTEETLDDIVVKIDGVTDPRDIQNRRPRISRELKSVEQKLQLALSAVTSNRLQGRKSPQKVEY